MTLAEKKNYLLEYKTVCASIKRLKDMISLNPEKGEKILPLIAQNRAVCGRIEMEVEGMTDRVLREILAQKYLCGKNLAEISEIIGYSLRQTERLHRKALESFQIGGRSN